MNSDYAKFDKLKERDRLDLFEAAAERMAALDIGGLRTDGANPPLHLG